MSVNVSVTDSRGRYVQGLTGEQFELFDDGVRQRVAHFSAEDAPFSLGVVYDMHFVGGLRRDDYFFLLVFNERASAALEFVPTADDLVAGNDGRELLGQLALDDVQVRAADAAGRDAHEQLVVARLGRGGVFLEAERARLDRPGVIQAAGSHTPPQL